MVQRPPAGSIPDCPGSYQFKDADGRVIYVGKAKSLRSRLSNYFQNPPACRPARRRWWRRAETVEWIEVGNEVEALMLEYSLIQRHQPRFNVRYRDDKSYPYLAVTLDQEWPRPMVMRGRKRKGVRYYGPFAHAYAIRETLDLLLRTFPVRTCSDAVFHRHELLGRPCLKYHIEQCSGPCVGEIDKRRLRPPRRRPVRLPRRRHRRRRPPARARRCGRRPPPSSSSGRPASATASARCARRSRSRRSSPTAARTSTPSPSPTTTSRRRCRSSTCAGAGWWAATASCSTRPRTSTPGELVDRVLERLYAEEPAHGHPEDGARARASPPSCACTRSGWRSSGAATSRSGCPQRGDKRALLETVEHNAKEEFTRHRLRRAADHNSRAKALNELQDHLGLPESRRCGSSATT